MREHIPTNTGAKEATAGRAAAVVARADGSVVAGAPIGGPAGVLALQRAAGNRTVVGLGAGGVGRTAPRAVQRDDDLDQWLSGLRDLSDMTSLTVQLVAWPSGMAKEVAKHLGQARLQKMVSVFGSGAVEKLVPADLLKVDATDATTVVAGVAALVVKSGDKRAIGQLTELTTDLNVSLAALVGPLTLSEVIDLAVRNLPKLTIDDLRPAIAVAPGAQRQLAADNDPLLALAKKRLDEHSYLELLPALGVFKKPTTPTLSQGGASHTTGPEADRVIRLHLTKYVADAVKAGRKVDGEVSVVGDEDYQMAFDRQWVRAAGMNFGTKKAWEVCNAFVDVNLSVPRIWVHRDRGDSGTVVHEGMHKYSDFTLRNEQIDICKRNSIAYGGVSQLDEGITEYFTRVVITAIKGQPRVNYEFPFRVANYLASKYGEVLVAKAYYDGQFDALKAAFGVTKWPAFALALEKQEWKSLNTQGFMKS